MSELKDKKLIVVKSTAAEAFFEQEYPEIVALGKENFFHTDYEKTLKPIFSSDIDPDTLVIEGGQIDA